MRLTTESDTCSVDASLSDPIGGSDEFPDRRVGPSMDPWRRRPGLYFDLGLGTAGLGLIGTSFLLSSLKSVACDKFADPLALRRRALGRAGLGHGDRIPGEAGPTATNMEPDGDGAFRPVCISYILPTSLCGDASIERRGFLEGDGRATSLFIADRRGGSLPVVMAA